MKFDMIVWILGRIWNLRAMHQAPLHPGYPRRSCPHTVRTLKITASYSLALDRKVRVNMDERRKPEELSRRYHWCLLHFEALSGIISQRYTKVGFSLVFVYAKTAVQDASCFGR